MTEVTTEVFRDRTDAGRRLADRLAVYRGREIVVYGLPRGGVVVAAEVARALGAPLDVVVARKLGHPGNPEYGVGAITDDGKIALNRAEAGTIPSEWLGEEMAAQKIEARRRRELYLDGRPPVPVEGRAAIVVDDGIATGYTMEAAILSLRARRPSRVVVAAPVAPSTVVDRFCDLADEVVVAQALEIMVSVGQWYENFTQVEDEEVARLMRGPTKASG